MARRPRVPSYGLHKTSGQARVIIDGKQVYLDPKQANSLEQRSSCLGA